MPQPADGKLTAAYSRATAATCRTGRRTRKPHAVVYSHIATTDRQSNSTFAVNRHGAGG
jgi:hypothetical protein